MNPMVSIAQYTCSIEEDEYNEKLAMECLRTALSASIADIEIVHFDKPTFAGSYDVILISANQYSDDIGEIYDSHPEAVISIGGAYPTTYPDEILTRFPRAILIIGEGELSTVELVKAIRHSKECGIELNNGMIEKIPNLTFIGDGHVITTDRQVGKLYSESIPMCHFDLRNTLDRSGLARTETGRGCDWGRCTFCTVPHKYNFAGCRRYGIDRVKSDIKNMADSGARTIAFTDEEFIGKDTAYTEDLLNWIIESKDEGTLPEDLGFIASISVMMLMRNQWNHGKNKQLLRKMRSAGFESCFIGIESGSASQLRRYGKGVTPEMNSEFLAFIRKIGIRADIGFIMFDPLMTFEELQENIRFVNENDLNKITASIVKKMIMIPNTPYSKRFEEITGTPIQNRKDSDRMWFYTDQKVREVLSRIDFSEDPDADYLQAVLRKNPQSCGAEELLINIRMEEFEKLESVVNEIASR